MIEIVAPDGSIVEFPDGTADAVITGVMRRYYPPPAAQTPKGDPWAAFPDAPPAGPAQTMRPATGAAAAAVGSSEAAGKPPGSGGSVDIRMPDGVVVHFPGDMPPAQIRSLILSKFPDLAAAAPADPWAAFPDAPPVDAAPSAPAPAPFVPPAGERRLEFDDAGNARIAYGAAPAAKRPDERSGLAQTLDGATATTQGVWSGIAGLAGMPVDLVNNLPTLRNVIPSPTDVVLEALGFETPQLPPARPFSEKPYFGSEALREAGRGTLEDLEAAGIGRGVYEPKNATERFLSRIGQEVGAQAVPLAGLTAAGARLGVEGARQLGPVGRFFVEPFAVNPRRAVTEELAAGVATGAGAQAGREMVGQDSAAADLAGSFAGGGLYGIGRAAAPAVGDVVSALTGAKGLASDMTQAAVTDELVRASSILGEQSAKPGAIVDTDPLVRALTGQPRVEQIVPGYTASTAEAAGDYGLSGLEASRASGPRFGAYAGRQRSNAAAVDTRVEQIAPTETPGAFSGALEQYRGQRIGAAEQELAQAQQTFDTAAARLRPSMTGEARGAAVRDAVANAQRAAKEVERAAWGDVSGQVYVDPLAESFGRIGATLNPSERRALQPVAGAISTPAELASGGLTDLSAVTALRSEFSTALREAKASGNGNAVRLLNQYIDAIDGYLDDAMPAQLRGSYDRARDISRSVNERFNRTGDPLAATLDTYEGGRPVVPDSGVAGRFVQPDEGQASNLGRLFAETDLSSRGEQTRGAIRDQILAEAQGTSGDYLKPQAIEDYILGRRQVFQQMPDTRASLEQGAAARRGVIGAEKNAAATAADVGPSGSGPVAKYLRYGDERAEDAMQGVLSSDRPSETMGKILDAVGNEPRAIEGARAAWWRVMERKGRATDRSGVDRWMPPRWKAFLANPKTRPAVERLYRDDPQHLAALDELSAVLENTGATFRAVTGTNPSRTALAQRGGTPTLAEWQAKYYEVARGRVNPLYFVTYMAGKVARGAVRKQSEQAFQKLLDDALLDRDVARALLEQYNPANRAALERRLRTWYGDRAVTFGELLDDGEDEQSDPVVRAILEPAR